MTVERHATRLENLPNELLIEIFFWFDARNLYSAFFNLNQRFNVLLQSLKNLSLNFSSSNIFNSNSFDHLFADRIENFIVHGDVIFSLRDFPNVRRLILINSTTDQIGQTLINGENLQMISLISPRCFYSTYNLHEKIFSNGFQNLTSCYLTNVYSPSIELRRLSWHQSPSMRFAKISSRDSMIHVAILSSSPNLYQLNLSMEYLDRTPIELSPHRSLNRLKLFLKHWPNDRTVFESLFRFLPFLRRLFIHRQAILPESIDDLIEFDFFAPILPEHLQVFTFSLHLFPSTNIFHSFIEQLKVNFNFFHQANAQRHFLRIFF